MDLKLGTTTSVATRAATAAETPPLAERYVGDLRPGDAGRSNPMFAGERLGAADGYASVDDAAHAVAELTDDAGPAAVLVQRPGGERVDAFVLEAPVWKRTWFRSEVVQSAPAHVPATESADGATLGDPIQARTDAGTIEGRLAPATYGTTMGTLVGIVDDTWARTADHAIDLGTPFTASPPQPSGASTPEGRAEVGTRLSRLTGTLEDVADQLGSIHSSHRYADVQQVESAWSAAREIAADVDAVLGFEGLPDSMRTSLEGVRTHARDVDAAFSRHGRLTSQSTAWASDSSTDLATDAATVQRLANDPWVTDLDRAEVGRLLETVITAADSRLGRSIGSLLAVPAGSEADDTYLPLRKDARAANIAAQEQLETLFERRGMPSSVISKLRSADATLEDATWQIVGKPSPDGRFNGVDLPGAIANERSAREALRRLAGDYDVQLPDATEPIPDAPKPDPTPTPNPTPTPTPTPTPPGVDPVVVRDVRKALDLLGTSVGSLQQIPADAQEAAEWLPTRKSARQDNLDAQQLLEDRFLDSSTPAAVVSTLRRADATLEDVTWQIVGKPSPDGRFNGVDIPGAISDTQAAISLLEDLVAG